MDPEAPLAGRLAPSLFGLAPGGVCRATCVAAGAVRSYRTLSPLPRLIRYAPRRFALCCTFPGVRSPLARGRSPAGRYPAPYARGARTFLSGDLSVLAGAAVQPTDATGMAMPGACVKGATGGQLRSIFQLINADCFAHN